MEFFSVYVSITVCVYASINFWLNLVKKYFLFFYCGLLLLNWLIKQQKIVIAVWAVKPLKECRAKKSFLFSSSFA